MQQPARSAAVVLATARLALTTVGPEHIDALLAYHERNDAHLAKWEPARSPDFFTRAYWSTFVAAVQEDALDGYAYRFVATLRGAREIVASITVNSIVLGVFQCGVLGYSVDSAHQAQGYGTEAVGGVVDWCFRRLGLHRIEANYQPQNERSARLLKRLGFAVEGHAREYLFIDGAWRDHIMTAKIAPTAPARRSAGLLGNAEHDA